MYLFPCAGRRLSLLPSLLGPSWCDWQLDLPTERPSSSHREDPEGVTGEGETRQRRKPETKEKLSQCWCTEAQIIQSRS